MATLRLKELRKSKGLTQKALAAELCLTQSQINTYENGLSKPSIETLISLADYFRVSVNELLALPPRHESGDTDTLLQCYWQLTETDQRTVLDIAKKFYQLSQAD